MEQLDSSVGSSSKPHSYASGISSNPPKTSRRLSYPKQPRNDSLSSSSNNATHTNGVKVVRNPNGSVSYQKLSRNTSSDSLQHEELASIAKRIYDSKIGKSKSLAKGEALIVDQKKVLTLEDKSCPVRSVNGRENSNGNAGFGSENVVSDPKGGFAKINNHITSPSETSFCTSPSSSLCAASQFLEAKESFTNTEVSECASSIEKSVESSDVSQSYDFIEGRKMSMYRGSTGSDVSEESSSSSLSSALLKPHKANDTRWEAIQAVISRVGVLEVKHFRLLRRLGCGDIGQVFLAELTGTRSYFAMKVMDKSLLESRKKLLRAQTEREILQCLDHPFLPTLYTHFETEKFSCLLMEFCPGGDLHALRQKQPGKFFSEHAARFYVAEVLLALEYLHMLGIIYRDLKPENVLVREDGHIMLSDFDLSLRCAVCPTLVRSTHAGLESKNSGYCVQPACIEPTCAIQPNCIQPSCFGPRIFPSKSKKEKKSKGKNEMNHQVSPLPELIAEPTNARSMSFVGTHEYLAPEIIKGEGHGSAVDWWTFGIFLYELLFGKTPFKGRENRATLFNVVGQPLKFPDYPTVSFAARDLIRGLLVKEPQHRLAYRRGATEIKQHPFFQSINWALIRCTSPPEVPKPVMGELNAMTNVKSSDNYLEIDFF